VLSPSDIHKRSGNHYRKLLKNWRKAEEYFPYRIPVGSFKGMSAPAINRAIRELEKSVHYELEWSTRNFRDHGRNTFPTQVVFRHLDNFLEYLGRGREFVKYEEALSLFGEAFPESLPFLESHPALVLGALPHMLDIWKVVRWRFGHPGEHCYLREIPALPHSKFVEDHQALFRGLFEAVLPSEFVNAGEDGLERRFGFKKREHFFICRLLDVGILRWPAREIALHPDDLAGLDPKKITRVFIVENQVTLHTLPDSPGTLAIHGSGYAVLRLKNIDWLKIRPVTYWGDIDENGFNILSQLRAYFPWVRSQQMNPATLRKNRHLATRGKRAPIPDFRNLTADEMVAYRWCRRYQLSIEQERLS